MNAALTTRHFQIFTTLMRSSGMAEAALKLGISKAAVSKTLKLLEEKTGTPLFQLNRGRLEPTAAARRLLPRAEQATQHLEWAIEEALALNQNAPPTVEIAAHAPPLIALLPLAAKRFQQQYPEVLVNIRAEGPPRVLRLVAHHEVDLGVTNPPAPNTMSHASLCESRTLSKNLLMVAMHRQHPLVAKPVIYPNDLEETSVIALPEDSPTSILIKATLQEAGVQLPKRIMASTSMAVCALIQQNVGVGLINPTLLSSGVFPDIVTRPFRPRIMLGTNMYYSSIRPLSAEAQAFAEVLMEVAAQTLASSA